ncbi:hypothetical protein AB0D11_46640 [Streptomyces monashensis]|uniref:hypothetical protein n=1 Tax=Streptomyces monashensis TaxID=1678012 RepID=UPI0033F6C0DC
MTLAELCEQYTSPARQTLSTTELAARDKEFYADRRRPDAVLVFGLNIAAPAVHYAQQVGLLDRASPTAWSRDPSGPG